MSPVRGRTLWPTSEAGPLLPSIAKKIPGRPQKKRRRKPLEAKNNSKTIVLRREDRGSSIRPSLPSWILSILETQRNSPFKTMSA